jgi:hypothetical protein
MAGESMTRFLEETGVYAGHVFALFWPNKEAPVLGADPNDAGEVSGWGQEDLEILIEEGRRQLDRQHEDLERIRGRSQVLLAFGLALEGAIASLQQTVVKADEFLVWTLWVLALLAGAWSILGAAATSVVRADMQMIHTAVLSRQQAPVLPKLAGDYAAIVMDGENQLATRLTNLRHAVMWLLVGAFLGLLTWVSCP